jgi:hypothetical protein
MKMFIWALFCCAFSTGTFAFQADGAAGYQKPGAPVRLIAPSIENAEAGQTLNLRYRFMSGVAANTATVTMKVDEGIEHNGLEKYEFDFAEDAFEIELNATGLSDGVYYVRFMVEIAGQYRAMRHKIRIGSQAAELQKAQGLTGGIRSMQAEETIFEN